MARFRRLSDMYSFLPSSSRLLKCLFAACDAARMDARCSRVSFILEKNVLLPLAREKIHPVIIFQPSDHSTHDSNPTWPLHHRPTCQLSYRLSFQLQPYDWYYIYLPFSDSQNMHHITINNARRFFVTPGAAHFRTSAHPVCGPRFHVTCGFWGTLKGSHHLFI